MLGYPTATGYREQAYYGEGYGQIFLDQVECIGNEESLNDCPKNVLEIQTVAMMKTLVLNVQLKMFRLHLAHLFQILTTFV
ncbi:hypothetical protein BSL78_10122 [Apostichopus japonicus]|uniref:SRCR domain-containing protein n=1 Tax=Stichopus japonicus TaxID=307972 RepID=A0A2G8KY97_STIJA|nr:hypothetical protein BSL78_10122 [Apostichopus japonicus]